MMVMMVFGGDAVDHGLGSQLMSAYALMPEQMFE